MDRRKIRGNWRGAEKEKYKRNSRPNKEHDEITEEEKGIMNSKYQKQERGELQCK